MALEEYFEAGSPLARRLAAEGERSPEALVARARELIAELGEAEKTATLNAHPRIGERRERMSERSRREQGEDVVPELGRLNEEYERRFGFRFVVFVNGRSKAEVAEVLRRRLERTREEELDEGLRAICDIAEARLRSA